MLRIEFQGQSYDWFDLEQVGCAARSEDFARTLRENIVHYFGVPFECQAIYDEEGLLSSTIDFARALKSIRPYLYVWDIRVMPPDFKEQTAQRLGAIAAEVARCQRGLSNGSGPFGSFGAGDFGGPPPPPDCGCCGGVLPAPPRPVAPRPAAPLPWPPQEPCQASFADRLAANGAGTPPLPRYGVGPLLPGGPMGPGPPVVQYDIGMWPGRQDSRLDCVEVTLSKDPMDREGSRYGFANVPSADGRALVITWVDPRGLMEMWNRTCPEKRVGEGDVIIAVNSAADAVEAMRAQLRLDAICMHVQRTVAADALRV